MGARASSTARGAGGSTPTTASVASAAREAEGVGAWGDGSRQDAADVLSGRQRVRRIPASAVGGQPRPGGDDAGAAGPWGAGRAGGGGWLRRALWRPAAGLAAAAGRALPLGRRRREAAAAAKRVAEVEAVVLGSPAAGWPRDDVPGLWSSLSWLAAKVAVGGAAAAVAAPAGPTAAAVVKVTSGLVGGRVGYELGRSLDRAEVAHVHGFMGSAAIEYAAMADAGPFAPDVAAAVGGARRRLAEGGSGVPRGGAAAACLMSA
ncbi:hypothetical protein HYH03_007262 [Edaphochlamys debaryana]|uniref:Uncharacterized protein n=1 Tax=Edaphochlamys debaryana TaxID=47281 RepID=A0A835Y219_9CHLO|nr:hypothetical protein HYH03_007262 [Edaphochlamys debaryana]|eukprot:KAG2494493.1 hypothetical protein HYH03_007262 [Edaphochlamys debaryana]